MKLVVFAHTPPPHHGQSYMVQIMLEGFGGDHRKARNAAPEGSALAGQKPPLDLGIECYHVNARLSKRLEDIGDLRIAIAFPDCTDLVLVWGEGFNFAGLPRGARLIFLNSDLQPENGHADVFLPISVQTERNGHYTNFQGTVSEFRACFRKKVSVADAEELFAALATRERAAA